MIDVHKLKEEQLKLSEKIVLQDSFKQFDTLAGIDQSYSKNDVISSIVVCDAKTMEVIEKQTATVPSSIPYIPGLLAYRELPAMIEAFSKLRHNRTSYSSMAPVFFIHAAADWHRISA